MRSRTFLCSLFLLACFAAGPLLAQEVVLSTPLHYRGFDPALPLWTVQGSGNQTGNITEFKDRATGAPVTWMDFGGRLNTVHANISAQWLNGIRFADQFAGATTDLKAQAAAADFAGNPGLVVISSNMAAGALTSPVANVAYLDLRGVAGVTPGFHLLSNPTVGIPLDWSGLKVIVGADSDYGAPPNDGFVATKSMINDGNGRGTGAGIWGNVSVVVASNAGTEMWGHETDVIVNSPTAVGRGATFVSAGTSPATFGVQINSQGWTGAWKAGLLLDNIVGSGIYYGNASGPWKVTQAVAGGGAPQTVTTDYNPNLGGFATGIYASVDTGAAQEDVLITNINGGITGVFTKNHLINAQIQPYTAATGIDHSAAIYRSGASSVGSIKKYVSSGLTTHPRLNIADSAGVERTYEYWDSSNVHRHQSVGGGWVWQDIVGPTSPIFRLTPGPLTTATVSALLVIDSDTTTTYAADASFGDLVLNNSRGLRSDTASHNVSYPLIQGNGSNRVSIDSGGQGVVFGGGATLAKSIASGLNTVAFSATPTFDAALGNTQKITLTGNVNSSTLSNATAGQTVKFLICQDQAGAHTFAWPALPSGAVLGGVVIGATAGKCTAQNFNVDAQAPVTVQNAGDTVTSTGHPFANGNIVTFSVTDVGIVAGTSYWVCNAAANTFQLDATSAACAALIVITGDGVNYVTGVTTPVRTAYALSAGVINM